MVHLTTRPAAGSYVEWELGNKTKLRGFSPQAKYTNRVTAACRRSCPHEAITSQEIWQRRETNPEPMDL
jgi:hypothetical protein